MKAKNALDAIDSIDIANATNNALDSIESAKTLESKQDLHFALSHLPSHSGIYQYYDKNDILLYIGKAKDLKKRIKSYFSIDKGNIAPKANLSPRIHIMVSQIAKIHTLLTQSEQDALILENALIKSLKPKYNVLLRDDKTYPYIYIDSSAPYPRFDITRQVLKSKHISYFGPYSSGARELLESLYEILPLVQKASCIKGKKACLFYQINKCLAPCEKNVDRAHYQSLVDKGISYLKDSKALCKILESKMQSYSQNLRFEEAASLRDRIQKIKSIKSQSIIDLGAGDYDVFALANKELDSTDSSIESSAQNFVLMILFIRDGRVISSDYKMIHKHITNLEQLFTQALLNYYKEPLPLPPKAIIIPHFVTENLAMLENIICERTKAHISILQPQIGKKKALLDLAYKNALEILQLQEKQDNAEQDILIALKELCGFSEVPYRIEVFDTSHHSGAHNVGGMVVWENGFLSNCYRRYALSGKDEYAQMDEMLTRRAQSFESSPPPDLWLLDGGKAQINIALKVLRSVGANVDVLAIAKQKLDSKAYRAKGNARDILRTSELELNLSVSDKRLQFCQKLRDEVHRWAISYHRYQKRQSIKKVALMQDEALKTYSKAQVKRLLDYFGSFEHIKNADSSQIALALRQRVKQT